jgi:phosphopantetheinyl transferase (holo-ACP synthase)
MKKKLDKYSKEKSDNINQLKSLFALFTQQRKALEISIGKSKKYEEITVMTDQRNKNLEEQHKSFYKRIEQLENDREVLLSKHKRDKE